MPVLSMPNIAVQQQQQTLRTDHYGYSTAQVSLMTVYLSVDQYSSLAVYVPISSSQFADVPVGHDVTTPTAAAATTSSSRQQQPDLYGYSSAQPLPPVPQVSFFSFCFHVK